MIRRRVLLWSVIIFGTSISALNTSYFPGDEFLDQNQRECFVKRSLGSCVKYKAAKILWKLATNNLGYFASENSRDFSDARTTIRLVHLEVPSEFQLDIQSRSLKDDNELTRILKFFQRTTELFAKNHGFQVGISSDDGIRISSDDTDVVEPRSQPRVSRGEKKKRKWLIILPLIILMKIAHLKMTVVTLLLATLGLNVVLIIGGGWVINYLKYKTLCKIHPHYIQSHSNSYESDPSEYSTFLGTSGFPGGHGGGGYYSSQEPGPYDKNWSNRKVFQAYSD